MALYFQDKNNGKLIISFSSKVYKQNFSLA